jgi:hypothetical protein
MASQTIDFTVIPQEDLYLTKGTKTLKRVTKGEMYPCQMQKTQNFNCLFRHYAKHNGLDKETLTFTFLEELQGDHLPDMVHLLTGDEICVSHRKTKVEEPELDTVAGLVKGLEQARNDSLFWDVTFVFVNEANAELGANKCVICNRNSYFCGMFRNSSMLESIQNSVEISNHKRSVFSSMLEFLYTSKVSMLSSFDLEQCTDLLLLANEYMIDDLKYICQKAMSELITSVNIARLLCFADEIDAVVLRKSIKVSLLDVNILDTVYIIAQYLYNIFLITLSKYCTRVLEIRGTKH